MVKTFTYAYFEQHTFLRSINLWLKYSLFFVLYVFKNVIFFSLFL